ncbi:MAG: hypothetical protein HQQ73_10450 [Desulfobulbaceae bacterium]|nr:hypothetical protein [Desulfobulbaceae bacterium]
MALVLPIVLLLVLALSCGCTGQEIRQGYSNIFPGLGEGRQAQGASNATGRQQDSAQAARASDERYNERHDEHHQGRYDADTGYEIQQQNGHSSSAGVVRSGGLPVDYQDFKARYAREGITPEGAVKLYFDAVFCYINPATRDEASKMLRYSMRMRQGWERSAFYQTFVDRMRDPRYTHIFRSFAAGTSVHNGYAMSPDNYRLDIMQIWDGHSSGDLQVRLRSTGADNPRSVYVRQYEGLWFVTNNAATYTEVRRPQSEFDRTGHDADYDEQNYRNY